MRASPDLVRGPTPVQSALARVRLPVGPRACEAAAIVTVALVAALVLAPLTLAHQLPNAYDTDAFYAPFATFLHDRLGHGDLPLWNPFAFSGQPFAADPQSGVFYPPALVSYGLFAPATGMVLLVTFHYLLATLSSYAFARLAGAGRLGAVYAGLAYGVSGYLLARSQALGLLTGAAWLAACVAAALFVARRDGRGASPVVLAGALAFSILGGSQQLTAVAATSALIVLVVELRWRGLAIFVAAGVAALGLAAVALLPRLELVEPLDGRQRRDRSGGVRHARMVRHPRAVRLVRAAHSRARPALCRRPHARSGAVCARAPLEGGAAPAVARGARARLGGRARRHAGRPDRPAAHDHGAPVGARAAALRARSGGDGGDRPRQAGCAPLPVARRRVRGRRLPSRSTPACCCTGRT